MSEGGGFKLPERYGTMTFEGGDFEGAVVRVRLSVKMGGLLDIMGMRGSVEVESLFSTFMSMVVVSWNIEDDDGPIPADVDGLPRVDAAFMNILVSKWLDTIKGNPGPLGNGSPDGGPASSSRGALALTPQRSNRAARRRSRSRSS